MAKYRILSLDGGGIRGVLSARLLERIALELPGFLDNVDLFAGTSTGSILACGFANGLEPKQMVDLYRQKGYHIFQSDILHELGSLWGATGAKYATEPRREGILPTFGDLKLKDLKKKVLVATFQLDNASNQINSSVAGTGITLPANPPEPVNRNWKPKFFHNYPGPDSDGEESVAEVIMRSSAAPVYFPVYNGFVDGGVIANNPSMCALAQALHPDHGNQDLKDLYLLSVGTGSKQEFLTAQNSNWGLLEWGTRLINIVLGGSVGLADYQCQQFLPGRYMRMNPKTQDSIGLDDVRDIEMLVNLADSVDLTSTLSWLRANWMK